MCTVYTTLDYEYKHKNKATGQVLVPTKCGVYKWDQKKYKISTIPIYIENIATHKILILTHRSHQYHVYCLYHSRLRILTREQSYWSGFGKQKVWGVQMRPQKLQDVYSTDYYEVHTKCSSSYIQKSPLACLLFTPL